MGRRLGLLVATSRYADPGLQRLRAPVDEAQQLRHLLLDPERGCFDDVQVLRDESKSGIEQAVEDLLTRTGPDDSILLYFSCHGIKNDHDRLFLAACNTELSRPHSTAVPAVHLQTLLRETQAGTKTVFLDCCYSGAFSAGWSVKSGAPPAGVEQLVSSGTCVITATSELEYAYEGDELVLNNPTRRSAFTQALLEGIGEARADADGDGLITVDELYSYVYSTVSQRVRQTPSREGKMRGSFVVARAKWHTSGADGVRADGPAWSRSAPLTEFEPPTSAGEPAEATDDLDRPSPVLAELLGEAELEVFDELAPWLVTRPEPRPEFLRVPVGRDTADHTACLDFKDEAAGGAGPHALLVGAPGSGKWELLRSLLVGLVATHAPKAVNIAVLQSHASEPLSRLKDAPHIAGFAADLDKDPVETRRLCDALVAEHTRRREVIEGAGVSDFWEYQQIPLSPEVLPSLIVVVDEFAELADASPEVARMLSLLAQHGHSTGIHLLLTTRHLQRKHLGRQVDAAISCRIALRTASAEESRIAIGVPDAQALVGVPGLGLLRTRNTPTTRFRSSMATSAGPAGRGAATAPEFLDSLLRRAHRLADPARPLWGSHIDAAPCLDELLDVSESEGIPQDGARDLYAPMGWAAGPSGQCQEFGISGRGNVAILGKGGSGKSAAVCTFLLSLSVSYPNKVYVYCVNSGLGPLSLLGGLNNVEWHDVAGKNSIRKLIATLLREVSEVEQALARSCERFLVIDRWSPFADEFGDHVDDIRTLAQFGPRFGLRLVITARSWHEVPQHLADLVDFPLELRLADPGRSRISPERAAEVPTNTARRGIIADGRHVSVSSPTDTTGSVDRLVERANAALDQYSESG